MYGYDYRALNLPFVQAAKANNNAAMTELGGLTYVVN
jgi:hypothetical protein